MATALILGIGPAQCDAIHFLKMAGWRVIGCGYRENDAGRDLVDRFEPIDIADTARLITLAKSEHIDLVYSIGSDLAMPSVSVVAEALGLPHFMSYATVAMLMDKAKVRAALTSRGLSRVPFRRIRHSEELRGWETYPAILKPVDGQGQRGVYRVTNEEELRKHLPLSRAHSQSGELLVEGWIEGPELSANVFVVEGRIVFFALTDRLSLEDIPGGLPRAHRYPSRIVSESQASEIFHLIADCLETFVLREGPVYFQIKCPPTGPEIIEMTPRLDGCHLWRLIQIGCGVDLLRATFTHLTGNTPVWPGPTEPQKATLSFFYAPPHQRFHVADFQPPEAACFTAYYYRENDRILPRHGVMEKVGYYILMEDDESRRHRGKRDDRSGPRAPSDPGRS